METDALHLPDWAKSLFIYHMMRAERQNLPSLYSELERLVILVKVQMELKNISIFSINVKCRGLFRQSTG